MFPNVRVRSSPAVRLFAFPHAGGSASTYQKWRGLLPDFVELRPAQLPGRELRFSETPVTDWREIVACSATEIAALGQHPIVLFGHSMGSLLAFEVGRTLRRDFGIEIAGLVVSGYCAPQLKPRSPSLRHLDGRELLQRLSELYGGVSSDVLAEAELVELMARVVKADLTLVETYEYVDDVPLTCPILAIGGKADPWVDSDELGLWCRQTTGRFSSTELFGDHFYLRDAMMERVLLTRVVQMCETARRR